MMTSTRAFPFAILQLVCLTLAGCGYEDFVLPAPPGPVAPVTFRWDVRPEPVLGRGAPRDWDAVDVLNPSIVRLGSTYYNLYSGYDGKTWHTGLATSTDGIAWQKQGRVLSPDASSWEGSEIAANGSALVSEGKFYYWYQAGSPVEIGLATSSDGKRWDKVAKAVLETGPRGSWDEVGVADPYAIRISGDFYLYYLGMDRARRQRLGVARSQDGVHWVKLRSNPILELGEAGTFDEVGLGEPAVWAGTGTYWMLYTGRDRHEERRIGLARSTDGVRWHRAINAPVLSGPEAWDTKVVCDPAVEVTADGVRVWFGGGDVARPDQNLHGQIGLAILKMAP